MAITNVLTDEVTKLTEGKVFASRSVDFDSEWSKINDLKTVWNLGLKGKCGVSQAGKFTSAIAKGP